VCVRQFGPQYGGLDVWGQLRLADPISDRTPGGDWPESIVNAIDAAKVMVMLVTENANESAQMARELVRGASGRAGLLVINPPYGFEAAIQAGAALIAPPLETAIRAG
jgi:hypothetical protein